VEIRSREARRSRAEQKMDAAIFAALFAILSRTYKSEIFLLRKEAAKTEHAVGGRGVDFLPTLFFKRFFLFLKNPQIK
jgi:hypothetical protein